MRNGKQASWFGCADHEVAVGPKDLRGVLQGIDNLPTQYLRTHRVEQEIKGSGDAEISATSLDPPKEIGVFGCTGPNNLTGSSHDLSREQVVNGQPVGTGEVARSSSQHVTRHSDGGYSSSCPRESKFLGLAIHFTPGRPRLDSGNPLVPIDRYAIHPGEVDEHAPTP